MKPYKAIATLLAVFSLAACGPGSDPDGLVLGSLSVSVQGLEPGDVLEVTLRSETLNITANGVSTFTTRVDLNRTNTLTIDSSPPARPCRFSNGLTTISSRNTVQNVFCGVGVNSALPFVPGMPFQLRGWSAASAPPSLIVATIGIIDLNGNPRTGATVNDFRFFDGPNQIVNSTEAPIHVEAVPLTNLTLRTALVLDISRSFTATDIDTIKAAAISAVATLQSFQEMSIFVFDSAVTQLTGYTNDAAVLTAAINSIPREPEARDNATNLYGAVRDAVQSWDDLVFLDQADIGYAVLITDGEHNANGLSYQDIEDDIGGREVFAIAIGSAVDIPALREVAGDPDGRFGKVVQISSVADLAGAFVEIAQKQIALVSGLHIVYHLSPKRDIGEPDEHSFSIEVGDFNFCIIAVGEDFDGFCRFTVIYDSQGFTSNSGLILVPNAGALEPNGEIDFAVPAWLPCGGATPNYSWNLNVINGAATGAVVPATDDRIYRITLGPTPPIELELSVQDLNSPGCAASFPLLLAP
ncbi:MAG: vWA domain-containing protein [Alcanivoracaceae bacterium]